MIPSSAHGSPSGENPDPRKNLPEILFRVECNEKNPDSYRFTIGKRFIKSGRPDLPVTPELADKCLTRASFATPFVVFTSKWEKAMAERKKLIDEGRKEIAIVPVYTKGLENVYDAYEVAKNLGYKDGGPDAKRQLRNHVDEYLILQCMGEENRWRILVIFHGLRDEHVKLSVRGIEGSATVPHCLLNAGGSTIKRKLGGLIWSNTGVPGDYYGDSPQLFYLVLAMMGALGSHGMAYHYEYDKSQ